MFINGHGGQIATPQRWEVARRSNETSFEARINSRKFRLTTQKSEVPLENPTMKVVILNFPVSIPVPESVSILSVGVPQRRGVAI